MFKNIDGSYELKLCQGCISKETCKDGFYLDNKECKLCSNGCSTCSNSFECISCFSNYYLSKERLCVLC